MSCLIENCGKKPHTRGLCVAHYQVAVISVRSGETTWDELIRLKMATEPKRMERGKKRKQFDTMLSKLRR